MFHGKLIRNIRKEMKRNQKSNTAVIASSNCPHIFKIARVKNKQHEIATQMTGAGDIRQKKKFVMLPSATDRKNVKTRVAVFLFFYFFLMP